MTFYVDHLLQTFNIPLGDPMATGIINPCMNNKTRDPFLNVSDLTGTNHMITEAYTQNKFYTGDSVHESDKEMVNSPDRKSTRLNSSH